MIDFPTPKNYPTPAILVETEAGRLAVERIGMPCTVFSAESIKNHPASKRKLLDAVAEIGLLAIDTKIAEGDFDKQAKPHAGAFDRLVAECDSMGAPIVRWEMEKAPFLMQGDREAFSERIKDKRDEVINAFLARNGNRGTDSAINHENFELMHTAVPTGFPRLDRALNGGLPVGLTELAAVSSMGKTTLVTQIADNIALSGRLVQFVSAEQGDDEISAKTISRYAAIIDEEGGWQMKADLTAFEINDLRTRTEWEQKKDTDERIARKVAVYEQAWEFYREEIAPHIFYQAPSTAPSVKDIVNVAYALKQVHGESPVIVVDYLQLLMPSSERLSDKAAIDRNVSSLRRLAKELRTPIVCICSMNRTGQESAIDTSSLNGSGGIEYSGDVILGLEPYGMSDDEELRKASNAYDSKRRAKELVSKAKRAADRKLELVFLKNRFGAIAEPVALVYDAPHNLMREATAEEEERLKSENRPCII